MSVQKFRSIEEMNKAAERPSEEPPFEHFLRLVRSTGRLRRSVIRAAFSKFRSIGRGRRRLVSNIRPHQEESPGFS